MNDELNNRIILWGAKERGRQIKRIIDEYMEKEVFLFVDSDKNLIGSEIGGVSVISPDLLFSMYNSFDTDLIISCFNYDYEKEIYKILDECGFKGRIINTYDFHNKYEVACLFKKSVKGYNVDFEKCMDKWIDNILSEVKFWDRDVASPQGEYWEYYKERINVKDFKCERVEKYIRENSLILDVGCGVCSQYGNKYKGSSLRIVGVDPLAFFYNKLNNRYYKMKEMKDIPTEVQFGMFELLSYKFGDNYCDAILIDNALDHCIDPVNSLVECLRTVKVGGVVSTFHHFNEAYKASYSDMHQWNICSDTNNSFIIWNIYNYINVNELLGDFVEIEVYRTNNRTTETPFGGVICNIKKIRDVDNDFFCYGKKRVGYVIETLMRQLANSKYAIDLLDMRCE
ncbi:MAG: methyltransferase domain-containing protein [Lachnospiraceae bacterium]|nr:methyltransferase domain-containing protein [Lachnospiraceae bacterium]